MDGHGEITLKEQQMTYTGGFKNNEMHGKGVIKYDTGDVLEGTFVNGKLHGKGKTVYVNGDTLHGLYENWVIKSGSMHYIDGSVYKGTFTPDGKPLNGVLKRGDTELIIGANEKLDREEAEKKKAEEKRKHLADGGKLFGSGEPKTAKPRKY